MRFRLTFRMNGDRNCDSIPISYQYPISAWIYKMINEGDPVFSGWLHDQGYIMGNKSYKLFTFSRLQIPKKQFVIKGDRMILKSGEIILYLSFLMESAAEPFILGLFRNQEMIIGNKTGRATFSVKLIERLADPDFRETMNFRLLSPIVINRYDGNHGKYLSPGDPDFAQLFFSNLICKFTATALFRKKSLNPDEIGKAVLMSFKLLSEPKSKLVQIKEGTPQATNIRGFLCDFQVTAPVELVKTGYDAGFGEKNSLGFGYAEETKQ